MNIRQHQQLVLFLCLFYRLLLRNVWEGVNASHGSYCANNKLAFLDKIVKFTGRERNGGFGVHSSIKYRLNIHTGAIKILSFGSHAAPRPRITVGDWPILQYE